MSMQAATIDEARSSITTYAERFTSCMLSALATSEQGEEVCSPSRVFGLRMPVPRMPCNRSVAYFSWLVLVTRPLGTR